jgi:hypothetical protein
MIRPYKLKHFPIHKVQSFVNFVVLEILCKPYIANEFSSAIFPLKYRPLIDEVNSDYIFTPLSNAFSICKDLYDNGKKKELRILKKALIQNNRIRELCTGEIEPVLYSDIKKINPSLCENVKTFCDKMYDNSLGLAPFYNVYGKIEEYYNELVGRSSQCRFCGINKVLTKFHSHRSALDHYLPKQHYPFSTVDFRNLVPLCDTCNSKYKLGENTLFKTENKGKKKETTKRVKAFYPFRKDVPDIKIDISLKKSYNPNIEPKDMEIMLSCIGFEEQIDTWDRLFGIKENYLAACCTEEMYTYYEEQYLADMIFGKSHSDYIKMLQKNRFGDMNINSFPRSCQYS